ncbi:hypothetical protein PIB30_031202 [Stylosanthes scabra]|uniref:BHLH domain-containing protein n=1 Tax=Stylosanthes scabra TaxID=79078 RepID=A0ABU6RCD2_9FABA|nr:hypothetical protein [Stylosanthes scabra]
MESLGAFSNNNVEFDCFKMFSTEKENDFTYTTSSSQLFLDQCSSLLLVEDDDELMKFGLVQSTFFSNLSDENLQYISQESSYNSSNSSHNMDLVTTNYYYSSNYQDHVLANDASISMDYLCMDEKNLAACFAPSMNEIVVMEDNVKFNENNNVGSSDHHYQCQMEHVDDVVPTNKLLHLKRKIIEVPGLFDASAEDNTSIRSENQKKKHRVGKHVQLQGCMKNGRSKKKKVVRNGNEGEESNNDKNVVLDGQSSSSNISEDDNASQENNNGGATSVSHSNNNSKIRTTRGTATDPQSLYARKRRERINERLRILQNLVPNGTKVDISTMLEEAVNYVKFLQLQIKLLSSDDLWMYAPLAYNGLDIGLKLNNNLKNFPFPSSL